MLQLRSILSLLKLRDETGRIEPEALLRSCTEHIATCNQEQGETRCFHGM